MSPTARTKQYLQTQGCLVAIVERWIPQANKRSDLFDCIDILCIQGRKLIGIQATSGVNHNARMEKAMASPKLFRYLSTDNTFEVWSWSQKGGKGERKIWLPRVSQLVIKKGKVICL